MKNVTPRRLVVPSLLGAAVVCAIYLLSPAEVTWVHGEHTRNGNLGELWWITLTTGLVAPLVAGCIAGSLVGRQHRKHYRPLIEGGVAGLGALVLGILAWAGVGGGVHGTVSMANSVGFALLFLMFGGPLAFLVGGALSRAIAW